MAGDSLPPVPDAIRAWSLWVRWLYERLGVCGLVALVLVAAAGTMWWMWPEIRTRPGISWIVERLEPIPKADPERFSVLVARLENDSNREHERLIVRLLSVFEGLQVLKLGRTIRLDGAVPEEREREGHAAARNYLEQSGASVLIWGTILSYGGTTKPELYLTIPYGGTKNPRQYTPEIGAEFRLPEVFWSDLADVLRLLVAVLDADFKSQDGLYIADKLSPFVSRVRHLLEASAGRPGWDAASRASTRVILADALTILGQQLGKHELVAEAIEAYRQTLVERPREQAPLDWARTQSNLGNALLTLAQEESGTARLQEAIGTFHAALEEYTRERAPLDWARTQNNLGGALAVLGEREKNRELLDGAIRTFRLALEERTRERVPLAWAKTQYNLGNVLLTLGQQALLVRGQEERGVAWLQEAIWAVQAALEERTRERVPLAWAMTQVSLGNALLELGEWQESRELLEKAAEAYGAALEEYTRERTPMFWARTQNSLGGALLALGKRDSGTARLREALAAFQAAAEEYARAGKLLDHAMALSNVGAALLWLSERENSRERLEWAVRAFYAALKQYSLDGTLLDRAKTQYNLGIALAALGQLEGGTARLQQAVEAYEGVLEAFKVEAPGYVPKVEDDLRRARALLEVRRRHPRRNLSR